MCSAGARHMIHLAMWFQDHIKIFDTEFFRNSMNVCAKSTLEEQTQMRKPPALERCREAVEVPRLPHVRGSTLSKEKGAEKCPHMGRAAERSSLGSRQGVLFLGRPAHLTVRREMAPRAFSAMGSSPPSAAVAAVLV